MSNDKKRRARDIFESLQGIKDSLPPELLNALEEVADDVINTEGEKGDKNIVNRGRVAMGNLLKDSPVLRGFIGGGLKGAGEAVLAMEKEEEISADYTVRTAKSSKKNSADDDDGGFDIEIGGDDDAD